MRRLLASAAALGIIITGSMPGLTHAAAPQTQNKGLYISPVREYVTVPAGQTVTRSFRVANLTDAAMNVSTSYDNFSVSEYAYQYQFEPAKDNWLAFMEGSFTLKPYEGREVAYRLSIPKNAPAGGRYFTMYAATDLKGSGPQGKLRAASLLYLTVDGTLTRTSEIVDHSLFPIVIGQQIPYKLNVKNTGNIHYFANFFARIDGLFFQSAPNGTSHLLMPGTTRSIEQTINSPLLPGIYKVSYGYKPDQGTTVKKTQFILFLPPWFVAFSAIIAVIGIKLFNRRRTIDP